MQPIPKISNRNNPAFAATLLNVRHCVFKVELCCQLKRETAFPDVALVLCGIERNLHSHIVNTIAIERWKTVCRTNLQSNECVRILTNEIFCGFERTFSKELYINKCFMLAI